MQQCSSWLLILTRDVSACSDWPEDGAKFNESLILLRISHFCNISFGLQNLQDFQHFNIFVIQNLKINLRRAVVAILIILYDLQYLFRTTLFWYGRKPIYQPPSGCERSILTLFFFPSIFGELLDAYTGVLEVWFVISGDILDRCDEDNRASQKTTKVKILGKQERKVYLPFDIQKI